MNKRHALFFIGIGCILLAFIIRLGYLQIYKHDFFEKKSKAQLKRLIHLYPNRGSILDRHLIPLAVTTPSYQIYALPNNIENKWDFSKAIASVLDIKRKTLSDKLYKTKAPFVWVARHCTEKEMLALKALKLEGVGFIKTEKRVYPHNTLASPVLGFVGIDNQGLGGLEYKYDTRLKGSPGKIILEGDPRGTQVISGKKVHIPSDDGQTIVTTLDTSIQFVADQALAKAITRYNAKSGQVIIMDTKTGDILAMASIPTFNANTWQESATRHRRIAPITDVFEPGSIFKVFTLASVLEEDIVSTKTTLHVPETYTLYNKTVSEAHPRKPGEASTKSVSEIIEHSLNVGTTLLALKLGEERFYKYIQDFGFGKRTNIELPGESKGLLRPLNQWSGVDISMHSFGQGIAVTGIQITAAMNTIANNGVYVKPRIIKYFSKNNLSTLQAIPIQNKEQVISKEVAKETQKTLYNVVQRGTGQSVKIKGYNIAGKTGTAQKAKANGKGYEPGKYIASFLGFFPAEDPKITMLVSIDSPEKIYYGSIVAGPVFKTCAEYILDYYNIPPSSPL